MESMLELSISTIVEGIFKVNKTKKIMEIIYLDNYKKIIEI